MNSEGMLVCFHSAPQDLLSGKPPFGEEDLYRIIREAASREFKAFQYGPFEAFPNYSAERLRQTLDELGLKRSVHFGGIYEASNFSLDSAECRRAFCHIEKGIELCREIGSDLLAFHPPFFKDKRHSNERTISRAKAGLSQLVGESLPRALSVGVRLALESFCYPPFIFDGLEDFDRFVDEFPSSQFGVVLEVGHLYQRGLSPVKAIELFSERLFDVHVHDATREEDFRTATHLPIGEGEINFQAVVTCLRRAGYCGFLTLEVRGSMSEVVESKKRLEEIVGLRENTS